MQIVEAVGLSEKELSQLFEINSDFDINNSALFSTNGIVVNDINESKINNNKFYYENGIIAFIVMPIKINGKLAGTLKLYDRNIRHWTKQEIQIIKIITGQLSIMLSNLKYFRTINNAFDQIINSFSLALEYRDSYTRGHSHRVSLLSTLCAQEMFLNMSENSMIKFASMMHDIGKITISEKILLKTKELTVIEWDVIKKHPMIGVEILSEVSIDEKLIKIIKYHHERWDGKGYPDGLKNVEIPVGSRIIAVADAYDAMTTDRPYHSTKNHFEAIEELKRCSGTQFDPRIVQVFSAL